MVHQKPLPALPAPTALSLDARQHRGQLIRNFLSEIQETSIESKRDSWVYALEEALDELGRALVLGKWLQGVRRLREQQGVARKREQDSERELKRLETVKAKKRGKGTQDDLEGPKPGESSEASTIQLHSPPAALPAADVKHLYLCVEPPISREPLPSEDSGFDMVPSNVGCSFKSGTFALQDAGTPTILFGNNEGSTAQMVGGTFTFKGVTSPQEHQHLFRVLRLTIYVHLALTLEQHLLTDSNITLMFPRPRLHPSFPSLPTRPSTPPAEQQKSKKHTASSLIPSGIRSFFPFRTHNMPRSTTVMPLTREADSPPSSTRPSRSSFDFSAGLGNGFRFSLLGPVLKQPALEVVPDTRSPFTQTIEQLQASLGLLSTSPGVRFNPPVLILELAEREKKNGARKLHGDERVGLLSVLGWEGKEHLAKGMTGSTGFVRQQGIEVLESHHVPGAPDCEVERRTVCGRVAWRTFRYFAGHDEDLPVGGMITQLVEDAERPCEVPGCKFPLGLHETRLVHDGVKVTITVDERKEDDDPIEEGRIEMWQSCGTCQSKSERCEMSDGSFLLSFGKFLEVLIYSHSFGVPSHAICTHTDRMGLRRHFSTPTHTITFACTPVDDIFELRVPRLQISRAERTAHDSTTTLTQTESGESEDFDEDESKRQMRVEIRNWWEGVSKHMDKLDAIFTEYDDTDLSKSKAKALPRLPSTDGEYGDFDSPISTMTASISGLPAIPATPPSSSIPLAHLDTPSGAPAPPPSPAPPDSGIVQEEPEPQPAVRLSSLRQTFHHTEQSLYNQLSKTGAAHLNDVRRSFVAASKGAERRLCAWQKKHLGHSGNDKKEKDGDAGEGLEWKGSTEPEWWKTGCHALPGSSVIVDEEDWGSIIAFTLSTTDYQRELTHISVSRQPSTPRPGSTPLPPNMDSSQTLSSHSNHSSFFSAAMNYKLFTSSTSPQPDPDLDNVTWSEPELFSAVVSRKEHPRDASSLLSIREVLRHQQKSPGPDSSRFGSLGRGPAPPSAWAKPDVQISKDAADGVVSVSAEGSEAAERILQEFESIASADASRPVSRASDRVSLTASAIAAIIDNELRNTSISSDESDATIGKEGLKEALGSTIMDATLPPPVPPKDERHLPREQDRMRDVSGATAASSITSTLTNGLSNAMRFVLQSTRANINDTTRAVKGHHGLLSIDSVGIDERPHIKYDWTIGKRLKFSCTVYYAKQFDLLRRRCGVDNIFIPSLQHSANWAADGGKSKSHFWKTGDDRFVIKTLVDAWNVADLQVLIDLAPSYFRYMDATANKATVLAKMMGFYTIEIRNLETGNIQAKADLLVMENLFYRQTVAKTFDLKGIQGRKVKPSSGAKVSQKKTLFDGEWIEGQQKALMLVRPHSKQVLRTAIRSDAEFLARSNIMDYSLLVGVDEEHKQIACGLVDTIGSYTFAKTLEYKAKHGLNSGKETTVIPPAEYQERFVSALEGYFLACPDKWSKPVDESKIISDANLLPSVL